MRIGHSAYAISIRNERKVGRIESTPCPDGYVEKVNANKKKLNESFNQ